ncbi:MAG: hypothetical protein ACX98W_14815 [bacterium]
MPLDAVQVRDRGDEKVDTWLRLYEGQIQHVRHHESRRAQSTNLIVAVSAAVLACLSTADLPQQRRVFLAAFLVSINLYGFLTSRKHCERATLHATVGARYRDAVSEASALSGHLPNDVRAEAHSSHFAEFRLIGKVRASALWAGLHPLIAALGIYILAL